MTVLELLSALCAFGSIASLVVWGYRRTLAAYETGHGLLKKLEINPNVEIGIAPALARASRAGVFFVSLINRLSATNRLGVNQTLGRWQRQLIRAGLSNSLTPTQLMSASLVTGLLLGLVAALAFLLWGAGLLGAALIGFPAGAAAGLFAPPFILKSLADERVAIIEKRLPFAIEFMLLAMEANAAFPGALRVYCNEMKNDPLADEFRIALGEIEDGLGLESSLARLVDRVQSESLSSFVLAVTTGIQTGQPIKEVLKVQADAARQRRYNAAESLAKAAGTRAVFPLFIVMVAALLLLVVPLIIKLTQGGLF